MADELQTTIQDLFPTADPQPQAQPQQVEQQVATPQAVPDPSQAVAQPDLAPPAPQEQPREMVPLAVTLDERRRRQEAQEEARLLRQQTIQLSEALQRLTQPQQPVAQPIDPNLDPAGALQEQDRRHAAELQAIRQEFHKANLNRSLNDSEREAKRIHGAETVAKAFEWAKESGYAKTFVGREDAYGEMVAAYQGLQLRQEIGDPVAYKAKLAAEIRQQVIAELKGGQPPPRNLPPSLASATSANGAVPVVQDSGDFFKSMFSKQRT